VVRSFRAQTPCCYDLYPKARFPCAGGVGQPAPFASARGTNRETMPGSSRGTRQSRAVAGSCQLQAGLGAEAGVARRGSRQQSFVLALLFVFWMSPLTIC
jgi:hypothetical protein